MPRKATKPYQTTSRDIYQNDKTKSLEYNAFGQISSPYGRSHFYITCPFCQKSTLVYNLAFVASGKKCSNKCGAYFSNRGKAYKLEREDTIKASTNLQKGLG